MDNELTLWGLADDFLTIHALVGKKVEKYYLEFETAVFILNSIGCWDVTTYENEEGYLIAEMEEGSDRFVKDLLSDLTWNEKEQVMNEVVKNLDAAKTAVILEREKIAA